MQITILTDNANSWFVPYARKLKESLDSYHKVRHVFHASDIQAGDVLLILSCEKIIPQHILDLNKNNIVVHPSKLPLGKGWSPLAWQVLEGKNIIPITLFEATSGVDAGDIYLQENIYLDGTELNTQIKHLQGEKVISMVRSYITLRKVLTPKPQEGKETFYKKRTPEDSELDRHKTLEENFNLLRTVDNEQYPAFFVRKGKKYTIKIYEQKISDSNKG